MSTQTAVHHVCTAGVKSTGLSRKVELQSDTHSCKQPVDSLISGEMFVGATFPGAPSSVSSTLHESILPATKKQTKKHSANFAVAAYCLTSGE